MQFETRVDFNTLCDGKVKRQLEDAFAAVFANICDDATGEKAVRRILLTFAITPEEGRASAMIEVGVKTKLAAPLPAHTGAAFGRDGDVSFISEDTSRQPELITSEEESSMSM